MAHDVYSLILRIVVEETSAEWNPGPDVQQVPSLSLGSDGLTLVTIESFPQGERSRREHSWPGQLQSARVSIAFAGTETLFRPIQRRSRKSHTPWSIFLEGQNLGREGGPGKIRTVEFESGHREGELSRGLASFPSIRIRLKEWDADASSTQAVCHVVQFGHRVAGLNDRRSLLDTPRGIGSR